MCRYGTPLKMRGNYQIRSKLSVFRRLFGPPWFRQKPCDQFYQISDSPADHETSSAAILFFFSFHHKERSMASVGHSPYTSKPSPLAGAASQTPTTPSNFSHASPSPIVPSFPISQPPAPMKRPLPPESHGPAGGPPERKFSIESPQGDHGSQQGQKKKRVSLSCAQCELLPSKKPTWIKRKMNTIYVSSANLPLYRG